jgi:DNA-binding MarR family transcriptional regulator
MFRRWLKGSLSIVHLHVLTILEDEGPMSMGRLADSLDVSVASATGIVDRMEQRGLVERRHAADDRRVVVVHPTEDGLAVFTDLEAQRRAMLAMTLAALTNEELKGFLIGLRAMARARADLTVTESADSPIVQVRTRRPADAQP